MPDTKEKAPVVDVITEPAVREFDNTKTYIYKVQHPHFKDSLGGVKIKYETLWPVPQTIEEFNDRYGSDKMTFTFNDVAQKAVQNLATAPNYQLTGFKDGELIEGGHEAMQVLADEYRPGRASGGGKAAEHKANAAKAKTHDSILDTAKAAGFDDIAEYIAHLVSKKKGK